MCEPFDCGVHFWKLHGPDPHTIATHVGDEYQVHHEEEDAEHDAVHEPNDRHHREQPERCRRDRR